MGIIKRNINKLKLFLARDHYSRIPAEDITERQRYKLFRTFSVAGFLVCLFTSVQVGFDLGEQYRFLAWPLLFACALLLGNYMVLQKSRKTVPAYIVMLFTSFAVVHFVTYFSGGIRNSGMFYLGAIILSAYMLLGNKGGKIIMIFSLVDLVYFFIITENTNWISNVFVGNETALIDQDFLLTGLLSVSMLSALSSNLLSSKNIVILKITESRNELQEKNIELRKLSTVASKTNNAVIITNNIGIVEWVNEGFERMTGYSTAEMAGLDPLDILSGPLTDKLILQNQKECIRSGETFSDEMQNYRKDGQAFWLQLSMTPIYDEEGDVEKYILIGTDTTQRKLAEEEKAKTEGLYRIISENSKDIICLHDKKDGFVFVSPSSKENLGYSPEELLTMKFSSIIHPLDLKKLKEITASSHSVSKESTLELRLKQKDGGYIYFETIFKSLVNDKGVLSGFQSSSRDIQKRKDAEHRTERYMQELQEMIKELDKFAYVVSHDLKAPLRAIGNLSSWIEEDIGEYMTDETRSNFKLLLGRVSRMEALMEGILAYSKVSREKNEIEKVDSGELLLQTINGLKIPDNFTVNIKDKMPVLNTSKIKLWQVFKHLISNAIKHTDKDNGIINIFAKEYDHEWFFSVEDNGPGIEPQFHDKIFVIFQTLKARDHAENTGVGLAIVKKIIDEQKGKIWVESNLGKGAKFNFVWPKETKAKDASSQIAA